MFDEGVSDKFALSRAAGFRSSLRLGRNDEREKSGAQAAGARGASVSALYLFGKKEALERFPSPALDP
jgi:hypothetical protein